MLDKLELIGWSVIWRDYHPLVFSNQDVLPTADTNVILPFKGGKTHPGLIMDLTGNYPRHVAADVREDNYNTVSSNLTDLPSGCFRTRHLNHTDI